MNAISRDKQIGEIVKGITSLVAKEYKSVFEIKKEEATEMASLIKGYPYAYQVLGYLCYKRQAHYGVQCILGVSRPPDKKRINRKPDIRAYRIYASQV